MRVITEKLDGNGKVISRNGNEITTKVVAVNRDSVELRIENVIEVAGKQINKEPQLVTQGFNGEVKPEGDEGERFVKHVGKDKVEIDGRQVESEVKTITIRRDSCRWTSRIHYSQNVAPYILRREISAQDPSGGQTHYQTSVQVTALDMPHEVSGQIRPTSHVKTVTTTPKGKTITLEVRCEDVPGGFISHTSKQLDADGRLVGRSTLELVEYHVPKQTTASPQGTWSRWPYRRWGQ